MLGQFPRMPSGSAATLPFVGFWFLSVGYDQENPNGDTCRSRYGAAARVCAQHNLLRSACRCSTLGMVVLDDPQARTQEHPSRSMPKPKLRLPTPRANNLSGVWIGSGGVGGRLSDSGIRLDSDLRTKSPSFRPIVLITKSLLFGVVLTVMLAWLIALTTPTVSSSSSGLQRSGVGAGGWPPANDSAWYVRVGRRSFLGSQTIGVIGYPKSAEELAITRSIHQPPSWSLTNSTPQPRYTDLLHIQGYEQATGFPFLAMRGALFGVGLNENRAVQGIEVPWIKAPSETPIVSPSRVLPLKPIWIGFGLDVLFWAAMAVLAQVGWKKYAIPIREQRNIKRGKCRRLRCGYPLEGQAVCPECGTPQHEPATG